MSRFLCCVLFSSLFCYVRSQAPVKLPDVTLEMISPRGLRISVPGTDPAIRRVSFHVNVNTKFRGRENGQYSTDVTRKTNGRWAWVFPQVRVKNQDTVYYWIFVVIAQGNSLNSYASYGSVEITKANPHQDPELPESSVCSSPSQTTTNTKQSLCSGDVVLSEGFSSMSRWKHQVTIGGFHSEDEFMVFRKEPYASWVDKGKLFIKPSLLEDQSNDTFVRTGELNMVSSCTSINALQCKKQADRYLILPPITSARVSTKDTLSFRYGIVEIRAKMPSGDWIVPELWLEPVNGPSTERVVLGLSRGNKDDSEFGWRTLEAGIMGETQSSLGKRTKDTPWSQDLHTLKLQWTPDRMQFIVDGQEIHQVSSRQHSIVNKEVYITLGVHVAGNKDFPETVRGKPWKNTDPKRFLRFWNAKASWYPSWSADSVLQVESVKITAL